MSLDSGSKVQKALRDYAREARGRAVPPGITAVEIAEATRVPLSRVRQELRERANRGMAVTAPVQSRTGRRYWLPGPRDEVAQGRGIPPLGSAPGPFTMLDKDDPDRAGRIR